MRPEISFCRIRCETLGFKFSQLNMSTNKCIYVKLATDCIPRLVSRVQALPKHNRIPEHKNTNQFYKEFHEV